MKKSIIRTLLVFGLVFAMCLGTSCKPKPNKDNEGKTYTITYVLMKVHYKMHLLHMMDLLK